MGCEKSGLGPRSGNLIIVACLRTGGETVERFGTPMSDVSNGSRKLTYQRDGFHITLYLSDGQIEAIAISP